MSRNLCSTICTVCGSRVALEGEDIAENKFGDEAVVHTKNARCTVCGAFYLAWVRASRDYDKKIEERDGFYDLSFRSTFSDSPGASDAPNGVQVWRIVTLNGDEIFRELVK